MTTLASQEFKDWFNTLLPKLRHLAQTILNEGEQHVPLLLIIPEHDPYRVAVLPLGMFFDKDKYGVAGKEAAAAIHLELASKAEIKAAIMVNETWTLMEDDTPENRDKLSKAGDLETHPDRKEGIMWNCRAFNSQLIATAEIKRPSNKLGKVRIIDPNSPDTFAHGRMIDGPTNPS